MRVLLIFTSLLFFAGSLRANPITVEGMQVSWEHRDTSVEFVVKAPTKGWVAVGFNEVDSIVGAELIMAGVKGDETQSEHFYVVGPGDPRPVSSLNRVSMVTNAKGSVDKGAIEVTLRLDSGVDLNRSLSLRPGTRLYLILAYSVSPDFDHHSRMRRHVAVEL